MMNHLIHLFHFGGAEKNEGPCLYWDCPRCGVKSDFNLILTKSGMSFIGIPLSRRKVDMADLRCSKCGYELRVELTEREQIDKAAQLTSLLKSHVIGLDEYTSAIKELKAGFVNSLRALTECWRCAKCGEPNPKTFDSCWKCGNGNSGNSIFPVSAPINGLPRSGNPWE